MIGQRNLFVDSSGLEGDPVKRSQRLSDEATHKEPVANTPVMITFFFSGI